MISEIIGALFGVVCCSLCCFSMCMEIRQEYVLREYVLRESRKFKIKEENMVKACDNVVSENVECTICLETFELDQIITILECGHYYHSDCLLPWLSKNDNCPQCRSKTSINVE